MNGRSGYMTHEYKQEINLAGVFAPEEGNRQAGYAVFYCGTNRTNSK